MSEGRWQIEACFRIMKTDFLARPVYVQREDCSEILETLRKFQFADVGGQGFMPLYKRTKLTDALHSTSGIETDFEFITKSKMKEIQKKSKLR